MFKTSPLEGIEVLAGLIPVKSHLQKIAKRSQIRPFKLPKNHILNNLLDDSPHQSNSFKSHNMGSLTNQQKVLAKGHLINSKFKSYGIFPSFSPLDPEFAPRHRIIDNFSNRFSFNLANKKEKEKNNHHVQELDEMVLQNSLDPNTALVITNASVKNDIATSISHIHSANCPLIKTIHYASFVTSSEAELFAIRCGINQACSLNNVSKIIVVTDSIHMAKKIFDTGSHPFQIHSATILSNLQNFFIANNSNSIEFWECPSKLKWRFHHKVDKNSKSFVVMPSYPSKISWEYCKKSDSDELIKLWKMTFQASEGKDKNFLELLDDDLNVVEPSYAKGSLWLQLFGHSNSLCTRATRAITNHVLIGEYRLRFFPNMEFSCLYNEYPIKSRRHILYDCKRFNRYWNPRRDTLKHFVMFLNANPNAFAFHDSVVSI